MYQGANLKAESLKLGLVKGGTNLESDNIGVICMQNNFNLSLHCIHMIFLSSL